MAITNGYCTLAELKAELKITNTTDDSRLEQLVTDISRLIDQEVDRRFYAATETRYYTAEDCAVLRLDDVLSVSALVTDEDGDRTYEITWAATDYDLLPYNAPLESQPKPYTKLKVTPNGSYAFPVGMDKGVKVTGSFGFASTTPPVVKRACFRQCLMDWDVIQASGAGARGGDTFEAAAPSYVAGLHPIVKNMLDPVRRMDYD